MLCQIVFFFLAPCLSCFHRVGAHSLSAVGQRLSVPIPGPHGNPNRRSGAGGKFRPCQLIQQAVPGTSASVTTMSPRIADNWIRTNISRPRKPRLLPIASCLLMGFRIHPEPHIPSGLARLSALGPTVICSTSPVVDEAGFEPANPKLSPRS